MNRRRVTFVLADRDARGPRAQRRRPLPRAEGRAHPRVRRPSPARVRRDRRDAGRAGVPSRAVFTDYAGFDTWATMVRAREVFRVDRAVVVTQGFHMARALSLGRAAGLDLHGLVSDRGHGYGSQGTRSGVREVAARVKGLQQAVLEPAVLLGPSHPISGDGRTSWGPADPLAPRG